MFGRDGVIKGTNTFIFYPGHPSAGNKVNCISAVRLYWLGCEFDICRIHGDVAIGNGEHSMS